MLKFLALAPAVGVLPLLSATDAPLDIPSVLASYGAAAPFAALLFWQMKRLEKKLDEADSTIKTLHEQAVTRERDLVSRVAPMFYDGARLYESGNRRLAEGPAAYTDVEQLARQVQALVQRLDER